MKLFLQIIFCSFSSMCYAQKPVNSSGISDSLLMTWQAKEKDVIGKPFGAFTTNKEHNRIVHDNVLGKVVFVNFWFEACKPCIAEFEGLNLLFNKFQPNKDFRFVSFTFENPETVARVKEKYNLQFPIYTISEQDCRRLNLNSGFPTTMVLDRKGIIQYFKTGGSSDIEESNKMIVNEFYPQITALLNSR